MRRTCTSMTIDEAVKEFGEEHRLVIRRAFDFLDKEEPGWDLREPVDRRLYIRAMLTRKI